MPAAQVEEGVSSFADMGQAFGFLGDLFLFMNDTVRAHIILSSVRIFTRARAHMPAAEGGTRLKRRTPSSPSASSCCVL